MGGKRRLSPSDTDRANKRMYTFNEEPSETSGLDSDPFFSGGLGAAVVEDPQYTPTVVISDSRSPRSPVYVGSGDTAFVRFTTL